MSTRNGGITPGISRRAHNLESTQVSRMKATLFAVGCMRLFGGDSPSLKRGASTPSANTSCHESLFLSAPHHLPSPQARSDTTCLTSNVRFIHRN